MKSRLASYLRLVIQFIPAVLVVFSLNCSLPSYDSPQPGIIEVRLKSHSTQIPHSLVNNFILKLTQVDAIRDDGARLSIFQDIKAIGRKANVFNTLDSSAYFGNIVLGQTFAPVGNYTGINLLIEPGNQVVIDGYRFITVVTEKGFDPVLHFTGSFAVAENRTTVIELTIDLDKSLQRGTDNFFFRPTGAYSLAVH